MSERLPVAILAGGLATRLRPVTETIPKALIDIDGEPFLAHQLRLLRRNGIARVVLCTGYLSEQIEAYAGNGSRFGLDIAYSPDGPELKGTAGALRQALPLLGERFLVTYGDSYLPCPYGEVEQAFLESGKMALMTVYRNEGKWDASNVEYDGRRIVRYDKKDKTPAMTHIDYGLGALHRDAFALAPAAGPYDLAHLYMDLLARGELASFEVGQRFYETGSFAGLEEFRTYIRAEASK